MLHKGAPGLSIGDHHEPIGDAFPNGPIIGKDVVVSADNIVGGGAGAGPGGGMVIEHQARRDRWQIARAVRSDRGLA